MSDLWVGSPLRPDHGPTEHAIVESIINIRNKIIISLSVFLY